MKPLQKKKMVKVVMKAGESVVVLPEPVDVLTDFTVEGILGGDLTLIYETKK